MNRARRAVLLVASPLVGLAVLALVVPRRVDLVVGNPGPTPVRVTVAGRPPCTVKPGAGTRLDGVAAGTLELVATTPDGAREVARLSGEVTADLFGPRPTWVWSIAPVDSALWVVSRGYGDRANDRPGVEPFVAPGPLFRVPDGLLPGLDQDFPAVAEGPKDATGVVVRQLWTTTRVDITWPLVATLIVDNGYGGTVAFNLDGKRVGRIAAHETLEVGGLRPGIHELSATALGPQGQFGQVCTVKLHVEAERAPQPAVWVWNMSGLTATYHVLSRIYGGTPGEPAPPMVDLIPERQLFRLPTDWYPHVNRDFPETWPVRGVLRNLWTDRFLADKRFAASLPGMTPRVGALMPGDDLPPENPFPPVPADDAGKDHAFPITSGATHAGFTCADCHTTPGVFTAFSCTDCHRHAAARADARHGGVRGYQYLSSACLRCHPAGKAQPR